MTAKEAIYSYTDDDDHENIFLHFPAAISLIQDTSRLK
jgi:hypothetical protein